MRRKSFPTRAGVLLPVLALACVSGCGGGSGGESGPTGAVTPPLQDVVNPEPGAGNTVIRLFARPFMGQYQVLNYFDHDQPLGFPNDTNGFQLNWRGAHVIPGKDIKGYDGHKGIDWLLPENTPVLAVTNADVVYAGSNSFACALQDGEITSNVTVVIKFIATDGDSYTALYTHLNRIDVAVGDKVVEGQQLGLSGATGCVGKAHTAHLHFEVGHSVNADPTTNPVIDPYGWEGPGADPWAAKGSGRTSVWFWKQGQAPDMVPQRP